MIWSKRKAYTLIELIVVIGVIVVLTALAMPQVSGISERNSLRSAAETIRQAVIEARTMAIAPKGDYVGQSNYTAFGVEFISGISKKGDKNVPSSPVAIKGVVTRCDDKSKEIDGGSKYFKSIDLPDGIVIDGFLPDKYLKEVLTPSDPAVKSSSLRFELSNFTMTCGGTASVGPDDSTFWAEDGNVYQVKLKNERYEKIRKGNADDKKYMYVNVNKYSGQVWISTEKTPVARVTLPEDASSGSDGLQDMYCTDSDCFDNNNKELLINNNETVYLKFNLSNLEDRYKTKFPKRARLWLTTGGQATGDMDVKLINPLSVGNWVDSAIPLLGGNASAYVELSPSSTFKNLAPNSRYSIEFNLAKYKSYWMPDSTVDTSLPIVIKLSSDSGSTDVRIYSKEKYEADGPVKITDGDSEIIVRPGPVLELLY